jgi:multidrug efflux pump
MLLSDTAVKRPVLATVANLLLIVIGLGALMRLPVRQYPDIDVPVVSVQTTYLGASAQAMESDVSKPIEEALSGIEGVRTITTSSSEENSRIDIEFNIDRNVEYAAADVRDQLGRIRKTLPVGIDDPVVIKASSSSTPVLWMALKSPTRDGLELTDFARRNLVDSFSVVNGVSRVQIGGERRYAMRVWLDAKAMAARGVSPGDVVQRLSDENVELPAGRIESVDREMSVRTLTRLADPAEFAAIVVRDDPGGRVLLGDIARVERGAATYRTGLWIDGQPSVGLGIIKQSTANTLDVANGIKAALEKLRPAIPSDVTVFIPYDESVFIKASIDEVIKTLLIAIGLVVVVILVFLRSWIATIIPMLAVPVSLLAACIVMSALGFSINVLTLLAMVLAIGLVVDDAIVVLENIVRRTEHGEPRLLAALTGSREVGFAVLATTSVLVAVFIPISFQGGTVGRLQREFGITLAATVGFSAFVALTLAPVLCSKLLRGHQQEGPVWSLFSRGFAALEAGYGFLIDGIVRSVALRICAIMAGIAVAVGGILMYQHTPRALAPIEDQGFAMILLETPQGSTMESTRRSVDQVQRILDPYMSASGGPVYSVLTIMPSFTTPPASVNSAFIIARLKDWAERSMSQPELVKQLNGKLGGIPGARAFAVNRPSFGIRDFGQSIQPVIEAEDYDKAQEYAHKLEGLARQDPGHRFGMVFDDVDLTKPQLAVSIDRDRAAQLGISASEMGNALGAVLGELKVTTYEDRGQQYDVILQAPPEQRRTPDALAGIYVRSRSGQLIPLGTVAQASEIGSAKELKRMDRRPAVTINAGLTGMSLGDGVTWFQEAAARELPPTAHLTFTGMGKEYIDAVASDVELPWKLHVSSQTLIYALALLIVFLVLAAQFESWIHPVIIIVGAPLAAAGGVAALQISGQTLNVYSQIGLIMLVGLVAKNGILMVEFANQLRDRGESVIDAMRHAARVRLRPILMTSIATIAGSVPLVVARGAGAEGRCAIGTVVIGGLAVATVLTLFVVPAMYAFLARFARPAGAIALELSKLEGDNRHPRPPAPPLS